MVRSICFLGESCGRLIALAVLAMCAVPAVTSPATAQQPSLADVLTRLDQLERQNVELAAQNAELSRQAQRQSEQLSRFESQLRRLPPPAPVPSETGYSLASTRLAPTPAPAPDVQMELAQKMEEMGAGMEQLKGGLGKLASNLRVTTLDSNIKIGLFGFLRGEMLLSPRRPIISSAPVFLSPYTGLDQSTVDVHGKSTALGAAIQGPQICCRQTGGVVLVYFFGQTVLANSTGVFFAQGYGELKSDWDRIAFGVQADVFNPVNPAVLNWAMYMGAGNTGFLRGQLRYERYFKPDPCTQWTLTGALSNPTPTNLSSFNEVTLAENNGWPNVEGRISLGRGPLKQVGLETRRPFEVGVSGVVGQLRATQTGPPPTRVVGDVWGVGTDLQYALSDYFGVRGEFYTGRGMGTYGGGIVQLLNVDTLQTIDSTGGWFELYYYLNPCWHTHFGYAVDDPKDNQVAVGQRTQNQAFFANLMWDVTKNYQVGFEISHWETNYRNTPQAVLPLDNEAMIYHFRMQYAF